MRKAHNSVAMIQVSDEMRQRITYVASEQHTMVHGTNVIAWLKIRKEGLKRMNRNHVHLCKDICHMRTSANVAVYVDVKKILRAGIELIRSPNNVFFDAGRMS